jgi:hypothetical protein
MISVELGRKKDGQLFVNTREMNSLDALFLLVKCELAWGAEIIEVNENLLVVETNVMNMVDTTKFSGSYEEMKPLLEMAHYYLLGASEEEVVLGAVTERFMQFPDRDRIPLIAQMAGPMLVGHTRLKVAAMLALGMNPEDVKEKIEIPLDDILAAIQLQAEGACSFDEALDLS